MPAKPKGPAASRGPVNFEIKSAQLPLVALLAKTDSWYEIAADLQSQYGALGDNPEFFENDPVVLDFSALDRNAQCGDISPLLQALRDCRLLPLAFRGAPPSWTPELLQQGLAPAPEEAPKAEKPAPLPVMTEVVKEVVREVVKEVPGPQTMVVDKPLRSGQKVYARGADLVVLAMVNQGAEVVADGNIHVYAPLRGKAMAGARGNVHARIFSLCLEPELISIAGVYRTSETALPADVAGKPAQVRLSSEGGQDKLLFEPLKT